MTLTIPYTNNEYSDFWRYQKWNPASQVLAVLNEIVWRNFSTDAWVNFKVFGIMPLTLLFSLTQLPTMMRHRIEDEDAT